MIIWRIPYPFPLNYCRCRLQTLLNTAVSVKIMQWIVTLEPLGHRPRPEWKTNEQVRWVVINFHRNDVTFNLPENGATELCCQMWISCQRNKPNFNPKALCVRWWDRFWWSQKCSYFMVKRFQIRYQKVRREASLRWMLGKGWIIMLWKSTKYVLISQTSTSNTAECLGRTDVRNTA